MIFLHLSIIEYGELSASDLHNMKSQLVSGCKKKVASDLVNFSSKSIIITF